MFGYLFGWGRVGASRSEREAALQAKPLEHLERPEEAPTFVAGGGQTRGALAVKTETWDAAVFSSRGRGYARYNEDAALVLRDEAGHIYAAVFDQAGGLGGEVRGEASLIAAQRTVNAFQRIARDGDSDAAPTLIEDGIMQAHAALAERRQGEVTTAVLFAPSGDGVVVVASGDSKAFRFDHAGRLAEQTAPHELSSPFGFGALTHAVGLVPEGPTPDVYRWPAGPGDTFLLASDGLLDSGLHPAEWLQLLRSAPRLDLGLDALVTKVLRRMSTLRGKPDNLSIVVARRVSGG